MGKKKTQDPAEKWGRKTFPLPPKLAESNGIHYEKERAK